MDDVKKSDDQSTNDSTDDKKVEDQSSGKSVEDKLYDDDKKTDDKKPEDEGGDDDKKSDDGDKKKGDEDADDDKKSDDKKSDEKKKDDDEDDNKDDKKYDLKKPKDSAMSDERLDKIASYAKEQGLSQEQAQAEVDFLDGVISEERESAKVEAEEDAAEVFEKLAFDDWPEQIKKDKEFGGDNYKKNAELTKKVFIKFGDEGLAEELAKGWGNHPALFRWAARVGKAMSADELVHGKSSSSGSKTIAEKLYGDDKKQE